MSSVISKPPLVGYPLNTVLEVMKPNKVNMDKESHRNKIEQMMASPSFVAEPKIDGCHYLDISGRFFSTRIATGSEIPVEKTGNFPHLVEAHLRAGVDAAIFDGEIYYPGSGYDSYVATKVTGCGAAEALRRQQEATEVPGFVHYVIFDILRDPEGNWLLNLPWSERREILEDVGRRLTEASEYCTIIKTVRSRKQRFLEQTLESGEEGIVLKNVNGIYVPGKRPQWNWTKIKIEMTDDVVIMAFDPPTKAYTGKEYDTWPYWEDGEPVSKHYYLKQIGSIVFGKYDAYGELVPLGTCTGIDDATRKEFTDNPDNYIGRVIKIKAMQKTNDGKYRHPNYLGLHPDKNAKECRLEVDQ